MAQAALFNNHSWDLWTQMWASQITRIQSYEEWLQVMESGAEHVDALGGEGGVTPEELDDLSTYLTSIRELAPVMLRH